MRESSNPNPRAAWREAPLLGGRPVRVDVGKFLILGGLQEQFVPEPVRKIETKRNYQRDDRFRGLQAPATNTTAPVAFRVKRARRNTASERLALGVQPLFWQIDLALYMEVPHGPRRAGIRLAAADADGVIAAGDDGMAV